MAIFKNGLNQGYIGKTGNTVTYLLNGKLVRRRIGKSLKPATVPQLASRQITSITAAFLSPLNSFTLIGFELEGKRRNLHPYIAATSYNRSNAIAGTYPDQYIDFQKVLLSKGNMPDTLGITVEMDENGLVFTWNKGTNVKGHSDSDKVMLMAYMPGRKTASYVLNAAKRNEGIARLAMPKRRAPLIVETYISFVSYKNKSIANSIYTGQFSR